MWRPNHPRGACSLALALALVPPVGAQDVDEASGAAQTDTRLDELERRNTALEARLLEVEGQLLLQAEEQEFALGLEASYGDVSTTFQLFGDVDFIYEDPVAAGGHSAFALGSVTFFANLRLSDHLRVLSETVVDADSTGDVHADQERLWAAWVPNDLLSAKVGVEHGPLLRWNQLYHHGRWLETTIERPLVASFEGGSGILPLHRTGLELSGSFQALRGRFEYFGTISNGRGVSPSEKQRTSDANDGKAIDIGLAFEPFDLPLRIGVAGVYDEIPADATSSDPARSGGMLRELIGTVHVELEQGPLALLAEFAYVDHESYATGRSFGSNAGYLQLAYRLGDWTPYTRVGYRDMQTGDPFFAPLDRDLDVWRHVLGVRRELAPNLALKVELGYGEQDRRAGGGAILDQDLYSFAVQLSWWL